jgi:hypothetical protein
LFGYRIVNKTGFLPAVLTTGFLVLAVNSNWSHFFYVLMRLTVCTIGVYLAHNGRPDHAVLE